MKKSVIASCNYTFCVYNIDIALNVVPIDGTVTNIDNNILYGGKAI